MKREDRNNAVKVLTEFAANTGIRAEEFFGREAKDARYKGIFAALRVVEQIAYAAADTIEVLGKDDDSDRGLV